VIHKRKPYKLASLAYHPQPTYVHIQGSAIGEGSCVIIAGPCAVESRKQIIEIARFLKQCGVTVLRGGAFKPRTSPYSFQGLGKKGLHYLAEAREKTGMAIVSEVLAPEDVALVAQYVDMLQIGARSMHNYPLLKAVSTIKKPVLLKRGIMATIEEFLLSAEYILKGGNTDIVLCERGIRTFETSMRNTLDIGAIPLLKSLTHLPVIVDPSHASGNREFVPALARAAIAAGADGIIIEVHQEPSKAQSDGPQSLSFSTFEKLIPEILELYAFLNT
jgi:3-deoxy-7-phosphoheptulonate synthase